MGALAEVVKGGGSIRAAEEGSFFPMISRFHIGVLLCMISFMRSVGVVFIDGAWATDHR
jgi:hypothetical protein